MAFVKGVFCFECELPGKQSLLVFSMKRLIGGEMSWSKILHQQALEQSWNLHRHWACVLAVGQDKEQTKESEKEEHE